MTLAIKSLAEWHRRHRQLLRVAVIDLDFRFISVNPSFSRITGYSEEEVFGQNSRLLDSSQHSAEFYRRVRDVRSSRVIWIM